MQPDTSSDSPARRGADIRTFLFADVRGYTRYTREHGDEAASLLAAKLAEVVRAVVPEFHGDLFELRGDEAVSMFFSAREAIRAAVELQRRLREQRHGESSFPLGVGMGIDSGEAVPTEGGFRGGALNLAARLCAIAKPGQILASDQTGHLAGRVEGVRLVDRRAVRLKGMEKPVRLVEVVPEVPLAPLPPVATVRPARWRHVNPRRMIVAGLVAVVVAGVLAGTGLFRGPASRSQLGLAANTLDAIEVGTNHVVAAVPVGGDPTGVAVGGGSVWVTSQADNHVRQVKLDGSGAVPFPVGSDPSGVAFGFGSAWVADSGQARISRITPKTGTVRHFPVGNGPVGVATGGQMVWVANSLDGTVMRIDPNDPARRKTFPVPGEPTAIAYGDGAVWVACGDRDTVAGIDPATGKLVHWFQDVGGPDAVAVGDGGVWVANTDGSVWRIDDNPNHQGYGNPNHVVPVGGEPTSLALTPGAVWVGNRITGMLTRIDPTTGTVVSRLRIGSDPAGIAVTGGRVWVAADAAAHSHRGGTLRVAWSLNHPFDPIDPAIAYTGTAWQVLTMTNDGLLTFRRAAGAAGAQLVADLATRIPTPTDGGKTYTFQLRRGIRYSTGALVRPSDVRASIERLFTARSPNPGYYTGIVGAESCSAQHCDLHQGIAIDNAAGTVTFHLRAPDPDFLDKLALPFADVLPAGTPSHDDRHVPATGPYQVASYDPVKGLLLVRNPHFRQWSRDAQPDGYPDRIALRLRVDHTAAASERDALHDLRQVEQGRADWGDGVPPGLITQVEAQYPTQFHENPLLTTVGLFLNTRVPPFNNLDARRAINYATNRQLVLHLEATTAAHITCQILPPASPGYRPYCPYTIDPNRNGQWTKPNLSKAKLLVRASRTQGTSVKLWMWKPLGPWGRYFARLLTGLGYPTTITWLRTDLAHREQDSNTHAQIGFIDWTPDYPAASSVVRTLFSCNAFKPRNPTNLNLSEWCDPSLDAQMRRAGRLQSSGHLLAANTVWASIDHTITNKALWVPLINPTNADLVSKRVGNYISNPYWGVLIDQMWVK